MLGKYLNGYEPTRNGPAMGWNEWDVGGLGYPEFNYALNENGRVAYHGSTPRDYMTDVLSHLAVKFIQKSQGAPFFIEIATLRAPLSLYSRSARRARVSRSASAAHAGFQCRAGRQRAQVAE